MVLLWPHELGKTALFRALQNLLRYQVRGVATYAKSCFGPPSPSKRQKFNATTNGTDSRGQNIAPWSLSRTKRLLFANAPFPRFSATELATGKPGIPFLSHAEKKLAEMPNALKNA